MHHARLAFSCALLLGWLAACGGDDEPGDDDDDMTDSGADARDSMRPDGAGDGGPVDGMMDGRMDARPDGDGGPGDGGDGGDGTVDDPCDPNPCDENADCERFGTSSYDCTCIDGFSGDGTTCTNVDECVEETDMCAASEECRDLVPTRDMPAGYQCGDCEPGYSTMGGTSCVDINECTTGTPCDSNATCTNTPGSFTCACNAGYSGTGTACSDDDECMAGTDDCDANATCTNTPGNFTCACNMGYSGDGNTCTDANECMDGSDNCDANATCTNTTGGFTCACNTGYSGDGTMCSDADECMAGTDNCDANATCTNTVGSFTCACNGGYRGDGVTCADVDECASGSPCGAGTCANTGGSYTCTCPSGYTGKGTTMCTNINECATGSPCGAGTCADTAGSYTCTCPSGYSGTGTTSCTDINECTAGTPCGAGLGTCANTAGSYACTCNSGYTAPATGGTCTNVNECATGTPCGAGRGTCADTPGSYACTCNSGYSAPATGGTCNDINECTAGTPCGAGLGTCANTVGSYACTCNSGYTAPATGGTCTNINECTAGTPCGAGLGTCADTAGSYVCTCNAGYSAPANGGTCTDINECTAGTPCGAGAGTCTNTAGSYTCACNPGYIGPATAGTCRNRRGHVVLMGHDFYDHSAAEDTLIGNAVFSLANTNGNVRVLGFQQYGDTTREVPNTNAAINAQATARGRTVTITALNDYTQLAANLVNKDVLLIYEMELGSAAISTTVGTAWAQQLSHFLNRGGVIIAMDDGTFSWQVLSTAGVITVTSTNGYGFTIPVTLNPAAATDPLAVGVGNTYTGSDGSNTYNGIVDTQVYRSTTGTLPVVVHKEWPCAFVRNDAYGYTVCVETGVAAGSMPCDNISASGTIGPNSDDSAVNAVGLGFTFDYFGVAQTTFGLSSNGQIGFPVSTSYTNGTPLEASTIAAFWDDLDPAYGGTGVRYQLFGVAGSRRFITQWATSHHTLGTGTPTGDIRARLDETTNDITMCYVDTDYGNAGVNSGASATVGLGAPTAANGLVYSNNAANVPAGTVLRWAHP